MVSYNDAEDRKKRVIRHENSSHYPDVRSKKPGTEYLNSNSLFFSNA